MSCYEDLVQEGFIGLIKSARRFDPARGAAFSSFAIPFIRGEMLHYLRDRIDTIRTPRGYIPKECSSINVITKDSNSPTEWIENIGDFSLMSEDPMLERLKDFLEILPDRERTMLKEKLNGTNHKDIAKKLRLATATVSFYLSLLIKLAKDFIKNPERVDRQSILSQISIAKNTGKTARKIRKVSTQQEFHSIYRAAKEQSVTAGQIIACLDRPGKLCAGSEWESL